MYLCTDGAVCFSFSLNPTLLRYRCTNNATVFTVFGFLIVFSFALVAYVLFLMYLQLAWFLQLLALKQHAFLLL